MNYYKVRYGSQLLAAARSVRRIQEKVSYMSLYEYTYKKISENLWRKTRCGRN